MLGKRLSRRPPALERLDHGRGRRSLRRQFVLVRVRLGVLQLHFQLIQKPSLALRAHAIERATQFLDLQPEARDQSVGPGSDRSAMIAVRLALQPSCPFGDDHRVRGDEIGRQ